MEWSCGCKMSADQCESGLYTYLIEDLAGGFLHYLVYNAPCNDVSSGTTALKYM